MSNATDIKQAFAETMTAQAQKAAQEQARVDAIAKLSDIVATGDMETATHFVADTINDHETGYDFISATTLRWNKPFITALISTVLPDADDIDVRVNDVLFTYGGCEAKFSLCNPTYFELNAPNLSSLTYTETSLQRHIDALAEYDKAELEDKYSALVGERLIGGDFAFAGDKNSNAQTKKYFTLSSNIYNGWHKRATILQKARGAKSIWQTSYAGNGSSTWFGYVANTIATIKRESVELEEKREQVRAWLDNNRSFAERVDSYGFRLGGRPDANAGDRESICELALSATEKTIASARETLAHWANAAFLTEKSAA